MTALLRGCLWKGDKSKSDTLDSRWGDTSISAPTLGGWNQLSSGWPTKTQEAGNGFECEKESPAKRLNSTKSIRPRIPRPRQCNSAAKKDAKPAHSEKPVFVYKPASESFLRDMAALGNPPPQPETLPPEYDYSGSTYNPRLIVYKDEGDDLVKELSEASYSSTSLETPQELRDMPHHPSYRSCISPSPSVRSRSSVRSSSSKPRRNAIAPPSPTQSLPISPRMSPRPEFSPVNYGEPTFGHSNTTVLPQIPLRRVDQPAGIPTTNKAKSHKRKVTEVMVPSSAELFG
ncbi:hypothetical protein FQN54_001890 [Arachnomyces sp. PD_36]|nr:hypothetical protein FQN54_001890 [Arachnomyces sp. PD_36]